MGGQVFAAAVGSRPALSAPRLLPTVYCALRDNIITELRQFFHLVACPPEAPGKSDHGDIDLIVAEPNMSNFQYAWDKLFANQHMLLAEGDQDMQIKVLQKQMRARYHTKIAGLHHFAVPHPQQEDCIVQLDLEMQQPSTFHWRAFMDSYGDFWSIVSLCTNPSGILMTSLGLCVIDAEIESFNKKQARTIATTDPRKTLEFFRMDPDEWDRGWSTEEQMFKYIMQNRFFSPHWFMVEDGMTSADKRRLRKRPCFARFCREYVPSILCRGLPAPVLESRTAILSEALSHFGIEDAFLNRRQLLLNMRKAEEIERGLKEERRRYSESHRRGYEQHWVDWFLENQTKEQRQALSLDMDSGKPCG